MPRGKSGLGWRIFGLRSAGPCEDSDSDQNDDADADPQLRHSHEIRGDCQSDDQNDESNQVSAK
jgi:hypothetical protein